MRARRLLRILSFVLPLAICAPLQAAHGAEALVAVATNFAEAAASARIAFEKATGHEIRLTAGASGKLYAQIRNGAPFHVLLSADEKVPAMLEAEGLAVAGTRFTYAAGRLVLWSRDPGRIAGDGAALLREGSFRHLAMANPELAPYGAAAREALQALGLWESLSGRIVMGQNVGQAHAMAATGNAELGLVALSALVGPRATTMGSRWEVPRSLHAPIRQDAVLLDAGRDNPAAVAFLAFLKSAEGRRIAADFGYGTDAD